MDIGICHLCCDSACTQSSYKIILVLDLIDNEYVGFLQLLTVTYLHISIFHLKKFRGLELLALACCGYHHVIGFCW